MGEFVKIGRAADVQEGRVRRFVVDGTPVAIYHGKGGFKATHDTCSHAEASLSEGAYDCGAGTIECPLHGARFEVATGKVLSMPAVTPVNTFPVEVRGEDLYVAM
jgi:3-phenylpropionate/trans-cinnamate dioxygenase ferredoxin subunit